MAKSYKSENDKILAAIERCEDKATLSKIIDKLGGRFGEAGGSEELKTILAKMVADKLLTIQSKGRKNGKGDVYRLTNRNVANTCNNNSHNTRSVNPSKGNANDDVDILAAISFTNRGREFAKELAGIVAAVLAQSLSALIGIANDNSRKALPVAKAKESAPPRPQRVSRGTTAPVAATKASDSPRIDGSEIPFEDTPQAPTPSPQPARVYADHSPESLNSFKPPFEGDPLVFGPLDYNTDVPFK